MESTKDTIVYTFGRFQPPTSGHQLLIDKVISVAKKQGAEHRIYPSVSNDPKKNPLSHTDKVKFMQQMFKTANIVNDKKIITPFHAAKQLSDQGYKNVILIVGGDRIADLRKQITQYIDHPDPKKAFYFDSFKVVSAGKRDPDSSDISGMSASKMRKAVGDKDFDLFMQGMPDSVAKTTAKKLYNAIAKGMNMKEDRDYGDEYQKHHASPEQRARRISRTVTRKKAEREGRVAKGDGKDIDHKDHNPLNDSPDNLRIKSKASNRSDNGHNPGEKQKQHEESEVSELTFAQRRNISKAAKKTARRRMKTRMRRKKQKKGMVQIRHKADKEAINTLKKKFLKGKSYGDLSHSEKERIDVKLKKFPKPKLDALKKKMLKVAREKERDRLLAVRGGAKASRSTQSHGALEDREMGTKSLTDTYTDETPGQSIKGNKMKSFATFNEAIEDNTGAVAKQVKQEVKKYVSGKLVVRSKGGKTRFIMVRGDNIDNKLRKMMADVMYPTGNITDKTNIHYGNISDRIISASVEHWAKALSLKESVAELDEISPPGFEGTVKAMKKHSDVDNPYALAWYMKKKGYKSHKKKDGSDKK